MNSDPKQKRDRFQQLRQNPKVKTGKAFAADLRKSKIHPTVKKLTAWRKLNRLSQRKAVAVLVILLELRCASHCGRSSNYALGFCSLCESHLERVNCVRARAYSRQSVPRLKARASARTFCTRRISPEFAISAFRKPPAKKCRPKRSSTASKSNGNLFKRIPKQKRPHGFRFIPFIQRERDCRFAVPSHGVPGTLALSAP